MLTVDFTILTRLLEAFRHARGRRRSAEFPDLPLPAVDTPAG